MEDQTTAGAVSGEFVTETFDYDGGRQVTVYVPPDPPEAGELVDTLADADDGTGLPEALIHADLTPPNAVPRGDQPPVIIDWIGAGRGPRVWPLAFLLFAAGPRGARRVLDRHTRSISLSDAVPDSCGPPDRPLVARNRRGRMGVPVYSPMRSAITSICRSKNSALASITLLNWPDSSKLTMPNS